VEVIAELRLRSEAADLGWVMALLTGTGLVFLAIAAVGGMLFRAEAMGMGDVKFSVFLGLVLGVRPTLTAVFLGVVLAGLTSLTLVVLRRRTMMDWIAYAPFLAVGALTVLFGVGRRLVPQLSPDAVQSGHLSHRIVTAWSILTIFLAIFLRSRVRRGGRLFTTTGSRWYAG
jgi:hypothetical protein